jgi:hypothetical protein
MTALSPAELGEIRGRASVNAASAEDIAALLQHIQELEDLLDEGDQDDAFGTEGWRHRAGAE